MGLRDMHGMIVALTAWIADPTRADLILTPGVGEKREIFAHSLPDDNTVAPTATVVRLGSASPRQFDPFERVGVQIFTRAAALKDAMERADLLFAQLLDAQRRPLRYVTLDANWLLHIIDPISPQSLPPDERKRGESIINVNIQASLLAEA